MQRATVNRLGVAAACAGTAALICLPPAAVSTPSVLAAPESSPTRTTSGTPSVRPLPTTTPSSNRDRLPPSPVTDLKMAGNDSSTFTVTWHPATDNIGVKQYLVLLNGAYSTRTTSLGANFAWFDNQNKILVQVAAIDAAGNRSQWRTLYIVPPARDPVTSSSQRTRYVPPPPLDYQTEPAPRPTHRTTTRPTRTTPPDPTQTASARPTPKSTPSATPSPSRSATPSAPSHSSSTPAPSQSPTKGPTSTAPAPTPSSSTQAARSAPESTPPS